MLKSYNTNKLSQNHVNINAQIQQNHKCYFHGSYNISKFCINKKCTLPLCEKCIPIHKKQHLKQENHLGKQQIIQFSQAYQIALKSLQKIIENQQKVNIKSKQNFYQTKKQIQNIIFKAFSLIEGQIVNKQNEIKIISQKYNKIKKGSLKTLIFYFSDEQTFKIQTNSLRSFQNQIILIPQLVQKMKKSLQNSFQPINTLKQFNQLKSLQNQKISQVSSNIIQRTDIKLKSSQDFTAMLRDQRNRLQSVKSKNTFFANNYSSHNQQSYFQKYGSKSVDNFYFSKKNQELDKKNQNRPLQMSLKKQNKGNTKEKSESLNNLNQKENSKQTIDKIRKKYIGDFSLSKEKSSNYNKLDFRNKSMQVDNKPSIIKIKNEQFKTQINNNDKELNNRIMSRDQIRINIQTRLNNKAISTIIPSVKQRQYQSNIPSQFSQTFCTKKQLKYQPLTQIFPKNKNQQFTLNKNYNLNNSSTKQSQRDKIQMSSIKRQLKAQLTQCIQKQPAIKNFFDKNSRQQSKQVQFGAQKSFHINNSDKLRQQISDFNIKNVFNEQNYKNMDKLIVKNGQSFKKSTIYEQTKQSIKLNQPKLIIQDRKKAISEITPVLNEKDNKQHNGSNKKQGRRFNYLYNSQEQLQQVSNKI